VGNVNLGHTPEGKRKRRIVYGKTKREAQDKLREVQNAYTAGLLTDPSSITVEEWLRRWMDTAGKTKRETTQERRKNYVDQHIVPFIGPVRLNKLALVHLEGWLTELEKKGRSEWTRHQAATTLGTALKRAVRVKLIPFNPAADLVKPKPKDREVQVYTEAEAKSLLKASQPHRLHALYAVEITSGMRLGELLALHWPAVDFDASTVAVLSTLKAKKGGGFTLEPPKSKKSRRTLDMPAVALKALNEHRKAMLAEGQDVKQGPVFVTRTGNYITKSNFTRQVHKPIVKRAGLPERKFHCLRHTHASTLLARGRNIKEVSERLGHASPELTLRVYAHLMPGMGKETAKVLDVMFG
jgi:integrase